jgi:hypothetical protein
MTRMVACLVVAFGCTLVLAQTTPPDSRPADQPPAVQPPPPQKPSPQRPVSAVALLRGRLPRITFSEAPLADVFGQLRELTGVNLIVHWQRLEEAGVSRDQPISIDVRNLRLSQVLWLVMNEAAGPDAELAYRADRDLIMPKLQTPMLQTGRVQDVPVGARVSVAAGAVAVQPIIGRYGSGMYFGGEGDPWRGDVEGEYDGSPEEHLRQLIQIITTTVEPESWAVNGGRGTISSFHDRLVVRNTPLVHQKLAGYLSDRPDP